jgi:hypothetical protein
MTAPATLRCAGAAPGDPAAKFEGAEAADTAPAPPVVPPEEL